ncbi:cysteine hydrolase [Streptomyces sp. NPDC001982]|uniref:cysteine hydrolase n=1 Tax=Streptomyces sp. NPDC001982 TaxID=3154405 RepID=UPI00332856B5
MTFEAKTTALLVMDYQPAILGSLEDSERLLDTARSLISTVRSKRGLVGFVRVGFTDEDYAGFPETSVMGNRVRGNRPGLDADAPTSALHPELASEVHPDDVVVRKTRVGAFSTTDLKRQLCDAGINTVLLAGVHTSGVLLTTVREAHDLDYNVVVVGDACADPDPAVHEFLLTNIVPKQGIVVTSSGVAGLLG